MADFNYDMFSLGTRAKEKLKEVSQEGATSAGIGAKPADEQEPMDKGFYESMYEAIMSYFDNAEDADRVLTAKEIDKDRTKEEVLREFDALDSLLSEDRETPMLDAYQAEDIDARMTEFDAQVGRYRDAIPAQIYTMESRAEQGNGLKDVTDTEEGKLSNEEPLYKMAEEIDPGTIDVSELPGKGLMSPRLDGKDGDLAESYNDTIITSFVDRMGELEGTEDHEAQEGQLTYAYGILPATAESLGVNPEDYETRKEFAKVVYGKMRDNAKESYPDVFEGMNGEDQKSVLSLYINLGRLPTGVVNALSGSDKDFLAAGDSLLNVIHYTDRDTNKKYSSKGLSKRRASEWNTLMEGREGFRRVTSVEVTGNKKNPIFRWLDANGDVVRDYTSSNPLSPSSTMNSVSVD